MSLRIKIIIKLTQYFSESPGSLLFKTVLGQNVSCEENFWQPLFYGHISSGNTNLKKSIFLVALRNGYIPFIFGILVYSGRVSTKEDSDSG